MRLRHVDWLRGAVVLFMIEWHAVDAWTATTARDNVVFPWLVFVGGWAAPLFLFLAGLALPLAVSAQQQRGRSAEDAGRALQRRGWQVFLLAHVFRVQSYLLNPYAVWHSIFKPDILNILGLGLVVAASCLRWAKTTMSRALACGGVLLSVAVLAPYSRLWAWPDLLHPRLEAYIRPNGNFGQFPLLPWLVFLLAGTLVGLWMARPRDAEQDRRFYITLAVTGGMMMAAGWAGERLPAVLPTAGMTSFSFLVGRIGAMMLMLAAARLWMSRPTAARWSPMVVFGQTSLFVYWVHVELAYGMFSAPIHRSFTTAQALVAYVVFTVFMLGLAVLWQRREGQPWIPAHLKAQAAAT